MATAVAALGELRSRVRPLALAGERALPVHPDLAALFPGGALRRGAVVGCVGSMAWSVSMALCAQASQAGAWIGVVGVPRFGLAAAAEWGVSLDRLVAVGVHGATSAVESGVHGSRSHGSGVRSAQVIAAALDGFELVIAGAADISAGDARRLAARVAQRGAALLLVGNPGTFAVDVVCEARSARWRGITDGAGRLTARQVEFEVSGRRVDRARRAVLWFPSPQGTIASTQPPVASVSGAGVPVAGVPVARVERAG